jgi:2-keto-4-pentenoate hydratase/2-oxohepta-3-ene-1,7-dioic acid hydratase in catechol pathway
MHLIRYQKEDAVHYGYLDGERVGRISGDVFGEFVRGRRVGVLSEVKLLAPCVPSKIIGVTQNFADRLREEGGDAPSLPSLFLKPPSSLIGPDEAIVLPPQSEQVEFGAELAVVIGRRARWVTPEDAPKVVLGYTCANDVTARDLLDADGRWARAKGFDTFCALGPSIATGLDLAERLITCAVNGETRQMSSTHDMLFTIPQIVAFVSSVMTLLPGDVLLTGTPAGAGRLAAGDVVEVEIEGIGKLRNPVTAESSTPKVEGSQQ